MKRLAPSLLAVLLLARAAAAGDRPDWLSGQSHEFPASSFLTGVGQGPTQEKAADKARAELAKNFSLDIEAKSHSSQSETSMGGASSYSADVGDEVKTSTSKVLDGVTIAQYWQAPDGYYALATLDRGHSLKILRDKLDEFDREFAALNGQLEKLDGKFARLRSALRLMKISKDRRRLNADYRILNPEGKGLPAPEGASDSIAKARKAIGAITVQVAAEGADAEKVQSRVVDALSTYGLKVVEKSAKPGDILLTARAEARKLRPEDLTWYWADGSINCKLSYGATGEVFSRFEESRQEAARDPEGSIDAVLARLGQAAADHAFKTITTAELIDD